MALEQSIDRLSGLIAQLIAALNEDSNVPAGAQPGKSQNAATPSNAAETSATPTAQTDAGKSSGGDTKPSATSTQQSATGESAQKAGLNYEKDVAPRFSLLVAKDRPAAIALMRKHKAGANKLLEAVRGPDGTPDQGIMTKVLSEINELLGG